MAADAIAQLRLLQLVSPSLPIGAFAYSRGMETAVELGWIRDEADAHAWIGGLLTYAVARLDAPVLTRIHAALIREDRDEACRWVEWLEATRETDELRAEARALGGSLARLLRDLGIASADDLEPPVGESHVACFALACVRAGIDARSAVRGQLWVALEGQVATAVKVVPIGQTAAARILWQEAARIPALADQAAALTDDELGALTPGLAIASALHETQRTRLFRS